LAGASYRADCAQIFILSKFFARLGDFRRAGKAAAARILLWTFLRHGAK